MSSLPDKPLSLEGFRVEFNRALEQFLARQAATAAQLDPLYGELLEELAHFMLRGGKRLRPYLTYLSYLGLGGHDERAITQLSLAVELYHSAWLTHDDIIDRDLVRYGGPNIAGRYVAKLRQAGTSDVEHLAGAVALVAGDLAMALSHQVVASSARFSADSRLAAVRLMQEITFSETGGEMLDVLAPTLKWSELSEERLLRIYHTKTAAYSFEMPLRLGAIFADASSEHQALVPNFAVPLGIGYQLADDLLGIFGNEAELGKSVLSDLREGKRTVLLLNTLALAGPDELAFLKSTIGDPGAGYSHLAKVREIMESSGARAKTEALARTKIDEAQAALHKIAYNSDVESVLRQLAEYTIRRHS